ncbi:MAG: hypothetical protein M0R75_01565 [Dehalococcoidia bacterium]|nr:hypothetical protein [Dehalococcoidia bacterium]
MNDPRPIPGERLGDLGDIRVSDRAAREFTDALPRLGHPPRELESARAWLADLLVSARRTGGGGRPGEHWRFRSASLRMDITATVDSQPDPAVVTTVGVRYYVSARTRAARKERER